jgi:hypothetical protein
MSAMADPVNAAATAAVTSKFFMMVSSSFFDVREHGKAGTHGVSEGIGDRSECTGTPPCLKAHFAKERRTSRKINPIQSSMFYRTLFCSGAFYSRVEFLNDAQAAALT